MKFEELSKEHQEFLMYCIFALIRRKVKEKEKDQAIDYGRVAIT